MKERPILFKDEMIRAILEGRKTQTRRVVKPPKNVDPKHWMPEKLWDGQFKALHWPADCAESEILKCPYGQPGDRLWVRETWTEPTSLDPGPTFYKADYPACVPAHFSNVPNTSAIKWRPSIHMRRDQSRINLKITDVRVERLQDIGYQDAQAEGVQTETADPWFYHISTERNVYDFAADEPQGSFRKLWESINGPGSWKENPWVWVIEFKRVQS
jgi:hypothetical protein